MVVQALVVVRLNVATGKHCLDMLQELRVNRHDVLEVAVLGAVLDHPDLAVALDDLRLDLADLLVDERGRVNRRRAQNFIARLDDALGAEAVGRAREAERGLRLLPRLQKRLVRPLRRERLVRPELVEELYRVEKAAGQ